MLQFDLFAGCGWAMRVFCAANAAIESRDLALDMGFTNMQESLSLLSMPNASQLRRKATFFKN